jgi:tripartite-type tricarboxylate transporter receptor subunit TctC
VNKCVNKGVKRRVLRRGYPAVGIIAAAAAMPALAQKETADYPQRLVTLVNPFAPGASTDIVARIVAQKLSELWGRQMVVENRPGASGTIGLTAVARSPADGHMLGMIIVSHAANAALQGPRATLDLMRDFSHMAQLSSQPYVIVVSPSLPARSLRELVALAKARPGAITYGSSGVGSSLHLTGELLASRTGVRMTHVPYKGAALALADVAGGHITMLITTRMSAQPFVATGRVRALAVTTAERLPGVDLPTVRESGLTGAFEVYSWLGIGGAAGTPTPIVERINQDINRVLKLPEVRERFAAEGTVAAAGTPAQFADLVRREVEQWRAVVKQASISLD